MHIGMSIVSVEVIYPLHLGDLLGYRNAYQAGHRIANGQKPLRYGETMLLLEACGWLGEITEGPSPQTHNGILSVRPAEVESSHG